MFYEKQRKMSLTRFYVRIASSFTKSMRISMGFLNGKKALIVGVASSRSIATGIANVMYREGSTLALTYQTEKLKPRVLEIAKACEASIVLPCNVSEDSDIQKVIEELKHAWTTLDVIIHCVAYAPQNQLDGSYVEVLDRDGFRTAHEISSYSFGALARAALPILAPKGALLTLTFLGAERVFPNYNVMGLAKASLEANVRYLAQSLGPKNIRVNAISAGPVKTLAAVGIKSFRKMLAYNEKAAPLRRNVTLEDIGNTAAFLCSNLASGITGEVVHVDGGFHIVGMSPYELELTSMEY